MNRTSLKPGRLLFVGIFCAALGACASIDPGRHADTDAALAKIRHVVVIYGENRSFDNLYGTFPGANGIAQASPESTIQRDFDGRPLTRLPPVWVGAGPSFDPAYGTELPNGPFRIDGPPANQPLSVPSRDLVHRYYENMAQIDGGRNDMFAALSDAGGLVMGHYDGSSLPLWALAKEFTLADNFFMGTFGGSYMNHLWLACACVGTFPDAPASLKTKLDAEGRLLKKPTSPASALDGPVQWVFSGPLSPDGHAINTIQPPYQPSGAAPAAGGDPLRADPAKFPLPPQTAPTIGDRLSARGVSWAWYAGAWNQALADGAQPGGSTRGVIYANKPNSVNFQPHHQPYNYFLRYAPGTEERRLHLKDGAELLADIEHDRLPAVTFYKPTGDLNEHPGYTDVASGDHHIADIVARIRNSPAWSSTLIIVTYDENGGFWDHVAPPSGPGLGDRWGPGTRIPAIIISPLARKGYVDHTAYDTTSILRLLTRRFGLEPLPDARGRLGDLTGALAAD